MLNLEKLPIEVIVVFALIIIAALVALINEKANTLTFITIVAAVIIAIFTMAYEKPEGDPEHDPPNENYFVSFSRSTLDIEIGDSLDLINYIEGDNDSLSSLEWSSSDPEIVVVNQSGTIQGMKEGGAYITVSADNNLDASCFINVADNNTGSNSEQDPYSDNNGEKQDDVADYALQREVSLDTGIVEDLEVYADIEGAYHPMCLGLFADESVKKSSITYKPESKYEEISFDYYACGSDLEGYNKLIILRDSETEDLDGHGYEISAIPTVNKSGSFTVPISEVDRVIILYECTELHPNSNNRPGVLLENVIIR